MCGDALITTVPPGISRPQAIRNFPSFHKLAEFTRSIFLLTYFQQATTLKQNQNTNQWPDELDALIASPSYLSLSSYHSQDSSYQQSSLLFTMLAWVRDSGPSKQMLNHSSMLQN